MSATLPILLSAGRVQAWILPAEGAALDALLVDGRPVLARTPWADSVTAGAGPAASEAEWVARWRGGWHLCLPTTGQPVPGATPPQGFHGAASQAPWTVLDRAGDELEVRWEDAAGLRAERTWQVTVDGVAVETVAVNDGSGARSVAVAEHLVLGGDVLSPLFGGAALALEVPAGSALAPLDYDGRPAGAPVPWPGPAEARWDTVHAGSPARVCAVVAGGDIEAIPPVTPRVTLRGPHVEVSVGWTGLPHLLLWEELGVSQEGPWNGSVVALGIEPTSTPHGAGTAGGGTVTLEPGARMTWRTQLAVRWADA